MNFFKDEYSRTEALAAFGILVMLVLAGLLVLGVVAIGAMLG
jgi:hypothetical protein